MKKYLITILSLLLSLMVAAQDFRRLKLPNREQLSAEKVLYVMQDSEGFRTMFGVPPTQFGKAKI